MFTFSYLWPIALVVVSNIAYHISTKSTSAQLHPLAALTVTYLVGAAVSLLMYFVLTGREHSLLRELSHVGWAPIVLGVVIVGLEVGYLYAYRAGWPVSTASLVQSAFLAIALVLVGYFFYHEGLSASKVVGVLICLVGLYFINK